MKIFFLKIKNLTILISIIIVFLCVSTFGYWFYAIGKENQYIQSLSWAVASKKIVIDPGHGGIFPGKIGKNNIKEKNINLEVSKQLAHILSESGAMVIMTRNSDEDLVNPDMQGRFIQKLRADLEGRVKIAKEYKADLYISIHCNSTPSERWFGAQTFYDPDDKESELLGKTIQTQLIKQLKNTKRQALVRKDTFLFRNLDIPTVIVECGFLSNPNEAQLLTQKEYQYRLAFAIYSGIVKYLSGDVKAVNN